MGTMEPVNSKDFSENEFELFIDRDGGTGQRPIHLFGKVMN
jgi:hypothetical protein